MNKDRTLKGLRADLNYSQTDVAKQIGLTAASYGMWENISTSYLDKIAEILQVKSIKLVIEV